MNLNELPQLVDVNPAEARELGEKDLNFLSALCLADVMVYLFPPMFVAIWAFLKENVHKVRAFPKLAIGIPRGFAKTTLMKIWIVYCVLFTTKKCIIIVSYIEDHAQNIIKDACSMLSHPNIKALFGDWSVNLERDRVDCKIFSFRGRKIALGAIGAKGTIRGLNIEHARPDVMIFEDYQDKKESESELISEAAYVKMLGDFMKASSPFGCLYIFVANMYPTVGSILKKLKNNPDWTSFIVGAILEDGTSLWEELHPIEQLLEEYLSDLRAGHAEIFLAEKLNDENAGLKSGIDITKIPQFPHDEDELPQGRAIVIDPSLDNPTSDYNGIGLVGLFDGKPTLETVILKRFTPLELIKEAIILGLQTSTRLICVESIAYQASLLFWFNKIAEDNGISGFHFMPLKVGGGSKNSKIQDGLKELMKREIYVKNKVKPLLVNEIIKFDPLKKNNQDTVLDLLTFAKKVIEQYGELMLMPYEPEVLIATQAKVLTEEENCPF